MPRTRAPCWGDISFSRTRLSAHKRRRGPAGLRDNTLSRTSYPDAAVEEAPEVQAAAPVGGGEACPDTPEPLAPPAWKALERPQGLAAAPIGGVGAWTHQNHRHRRREGRQRKQRARLRRPWAAGLAGHTRTTGTAGVEGAGGTGGHGRASRRGAERSEVA